MTNIIKFEGFEDSNIRVTADGRYSVYDVIRFCSNSKSGAERKSWSRLCEQYSELAAKCDNFKFPGAGQRETPVASKETLQEICLFLGVGREAVTSNKFYPRTEVQIMQVLIEAFSDCDPCIQFYCCGYRIDLYLAKPRIAIECDEYGHTCYNTKDEDARERAIKSALGCSFIRFDPYSDDFNVGQIVKKVRQLI